MGDCMEPATSLWLFNVFVIAAFGWFFFYFYSMFHAIADLNDDLISLLGLKKPLEDEGQMTLTEFFPEEEE